MAERDRGRVTDTYDGRERDSGYRSRGGYERERSDSRDRRRDDRRDYDDDRHRSRRARSRSRERDDGGRRGMSRSRSRSHSRQRDDRRDSKRRSRSREGDRHRDDDRRKRSRQDEASPSPRKEAEKSSGAPVQVSTAPSVPAAGDIPPEDDEEAMMRMMGLPVGFDSTQNKHVEGNDKNFGAKVIKERKYRQYMNRVTKNKELD